VTLLLLKNFCFFALSFAVKKQKSHYKDVAVMIFHSRLYYFKNSLLNTY
jgi:hypothetical protein